MSIFTSYISVKFTSSPILISKREFVHATSKNDNSLRHLFYSIYRLEEKVSPFAFTASTVTSVRFRKLMFYFFFLIEHLHHIIASDSNFRTDLLNIIYQYA